MTSLEKLVGWLLSVRHETKLSWMEPWSGLGENGEGHTSHVEYRATVHDCIAIQRIIWEAGGLDHNGKDAELLKDFITVNWCVIAD